MIFKTLIFILSLNFLLLGNSCSYVSSTLFYEDPLTAVEHNNLGVAYEREGKFDLAIREYKMAIDKDKDFTVSIINLGNVYFARGEIKKAEKQYKKALEIEPGNITAVNNLANIYLHRNRDFDEAIELMTANIDNAQDMPGYYLDTLGRLYISAGEKEKGRDVLFEACKKTGDDRGLRESINSYLEEHNLGSCP